MLVESAWAATPQTVPPLNFPVRGQSESWWHAGAECSQKCQEKRVQLKVSV